jgi:hypothetical protein
MSERPRSPIPPQIAAIAPDGNLTPRQARRLLIEMSLRKQKPGAGSAHEFLRRRTALNPWPDLREILKGIEWLIIGGVATRAYMAERMTKDMDVLVHHTDGEEVMERLRRAGYTVLSRLVVPGYLLRSPDNQEIDVLFGKQKWLKEALSHPERDPAGYPVLGFPYLMLMKVTAARPQDWADVSRMAAVASEEQLTEARAVVARYSPRDSEDLEALILLGKREMEMPQDDSETDEADS